MKNLAPEEVENISLSKAWEISKDFSSFISEEKNLWGTEDTLPYSKNIIILALLIILGDEDFKKLAVLNNTTEHNAKYLIVQNILTLVNFFPSDSEQNKKNIKFMEMAKKALRLSDRDTSAGEPK